ncbi:hypothetical protein DTO217A2_6641 [Paecilomyces variotii]|nr:hypothetical protein DTO217A2_6641 [Paecilomyces variotii]
MASPVSRKRKSTDEHHQSRNADGSWKPSTGPVQKKLRITQSQKQALIDNLQLEITERARNLRAHYALQAQDLRARIERRVNRIPVALRKANIGELFEKYKSANQSGQAAPSLEKQPSKTTTNVKASSGDVRYPSISPGKTHPRGIKRQSEVNLYSDKENAPASTDTYDKIDVPKKRGNPKTMAGPSRVISQTMREADAKILSPKSNNSRTYAVSPLKASPEKHHLSYMSRPVSPFKLSSPIKPGTVVAAMVDNARARARDTASKDSRPPSQAKKTTTRPASRATPSSLKSPARPATRQQDRTVSSGTTASNTSSGTTVVRSTRTGAGTRKAGPTAATKKTVARSQAATATSAAKKTTTASRRAGTATPVSETPATGRRVLRRRV